MRIWSSSFESIRSAAISTIIINSNSSIIMSFFGKQYVLDSQENFDALLDSFGDAVSEDAKKALLNHKGIIVLEKDGDGFKLTTSSPSGQNTTSFKSGVEFDEKVRGIIDAKTTYTLDGNVLTHVQKFPNGTVTTKREFSDDKIIVTATSSEWDGKATRIYKAA